jgi:glyoxylase-like metal-dependent hydrolase (beta-lactamase superfamily II)
MTEPGRAPTVHRLHLATLHVAGAGDWPVHGFVVKHERGALLVDTGVGGPEQLLADWRVVNRAVADALAEIDLAPSDIDLVVNTHLHFDHCGQNSVFPHAPVYVQRAEAERAERESRSLWDWFGFMNARFELLDGDAEIVPGVRVIATPGHTVGHQCVLVGEAGADLLVGDAAYNPFLFADPDRGEEQLPPGQAADVRAWRDSIRRLHAAGPARVHFCHDTAVIES